MTDDTLREGEDYRVSVADGKYTYVHMADGRSHALRYGEEWRDLVGDRFVGSLAMELDETRKQLAAALASNRGQRVDTLPRLVAAAIRVKVRAHRGVTNRELIFTAPPPLRHADIIHSMVSFNINATRLAVPENQGFVTDGGIFMGRIPAYHLAKDNGQLKREGGMEELYSEDLW